LKNSIFLIVSLFTFLFITQQTVYSTEIGLVPTSIPEGNYSILLYKPQRTETPLKNEKLGYTITPITYSSYIKSFDVLYESNFTDWTVSKEYEIKKFGSPLESISSDLETSIDGIQYTYEKRLQVKLKRFYEKDISYGSYQGKEGKFELQLSNMKYYLFSRTFLVGWKEYSFIVLFPKQYERYVNPNKFLNSFKLN
jgi:hypothetical protein